MEDYQALGYYMINSTEITLTTRIYHGSIPESDTNFPVINYFMVSQPNVAYGAAERKRYQISCRAKTPAAAMNLAKQVKSAFTEVQDSVGSSFDIQNTHFEAAVFLTEPNNVYHVPVDVFIMYTNY